MVSPAKIYLWYDEITKKYVTGKSTEHNKSRTEVLFAFELEHVTLCQKIARNLNKIR